MKIVSLLVFDAMILGYDFLQVFSWVTLFR